MDPDPDAKHGYLRYGTRLNSTVPTAPRDQQSPALLWTMGPHTLCRKDEERVLARLSTAKYLRRLNIHGFSDRFHVGHEVRERALIFIFIYLFIYVFVWVPYFLVGSSDIWFVGTFRRHSCCLKTLFHCEILSVPVEVPTNQCFACVRTGNAELKFLHY